VEREREKDIHFLRYGTIPLFFEVSTFDQLPTCSEREAAGRQSVSG